MGDITLALYNETPQHRDNFIQLVKEGVYDSTLFHRVISQFMIQGGDPESKHAADTALLGNGDLGYTVPAEFVEGIYHRRGALAAAREGDDVNPTKASSSCQFYIVTGRKYTPAQLEAVEIRVNDARRQVISDSLTHLHESEIMQLRRAGNNAGLIALQDTIYARTQALADKEEKFKLTDEQVRLYTTVGGAAHLDGAYTVFGEVVKGMDVVSAIESLKTNNADRPISNVRIVKASIISE